MNRIAITLALSVLLLPTAQSQIKHIEMRVEGMT